jgi:hypothetical protein
MEALIYALAGALFVVLMFLPARQRLDQWPLDSAD